MSDIGTMIRHHYEDATPSIDIDALAERMETRQARSKPQVRRGLAIAFVAAVLVLIAVAIPMLLNNPSEAPVISPSLPSSTTAAPAETTIPTPTTATVSPTTMLSPPTTLPPAWSTFTESNGAPAGRIHQVLAVSDGSVWVIGDGGIARHDGEWEAVTTPPEGFVVDPMALPDPDALLNHRQSTVRAAEGPDGSVWFSHYGGVHQYLNGEWTAYPEPVEDRPDSPAEPWVLPPIEIGVMGNGSVWISAGDMIWTLQESDWVIVDDEFAPTTDWGYNLGAYEIVIADDGALWISHGESGLIRYDGTGARIEPYSWSGWYLTEVRAATADGAWIVAGYGEPDRRLIYISEDGRAEYPLGDATDVAVGPDGTVWVTVTAQPIDPCFGYCGPVEPVSEAGVYRYDGTSWVQYTTEDGLVSNDALSVSVGPDGTVWFGTRAGISRLLPEHAERGGQAVDW